MMKFIEEDDMNKNKSDIYQIINWKGYSIRQSLIGSFDIYCHIQKSSNHSMQSDHFIAI